MNDWLDFSGGVFVMWTSWMLYVWATVYPWITGGTALIAFIIAVHSLGRLVWRWYNGENTIKSDD